MADRCCFRWKEVAQRQRRLIGLVLAGCCFRWKEVARLATACRRRLSVFPYLCPSSQREIQKGADGRGDEGIADGKVTRTLRERSAEPGSREMTPTFVSPRPGSRLL
jgi:hypothetical protein